MGESYGPFIKGNDQALMPYIDACNIACGMHAGDPIHMQLTIQAAMNHGLEIGAHPGYPDIQGFGRRPMNYPADDLQALLYYQLGAFEKMVKVNGTHVTHVKAHGALYNLAAKDEETAIVIAKVIQDATPDAIIYVPANSIQLEVAKRMGLKYKIEAFIDRRYTKDLQLASRNTKGAVIENSASALEQVKSLFHSREITTIESEKRNIEADTFCIHGDNPSALDIVKKIRADL